MELVESELRELDKLGFDTLITGFDFDFSIDTDEFDEDDTYTKVVNIPQYEPTGEDVTLSDCLNTEKYDELIDHINKSSLPESEKQFLRFAAARHLQFTYKNIAEYYAQAGPEMQELMEQSALVIIDVEDAIANGYAKLKSYLDEIEERDYGEE